MKRVVKSMGMGPLPSVLYIDDLERIVALFVEAGFPIKSIVLGGFEWESLNDLKQSDLTSGYRDLRISLFGDPFSLENHVALSASRFGFDVRIGDRDSLTQLGLRSAVISMLERRRLHFMSLRYSFVLGVGGLALIGVKSVLQQPWAGYASALSTGVAVAQIGFWLVVIWQFRSAGLVRLQPSSSRLPWYRENRDVLVAIVGAVAGAILTVIIGAIALNVLGINFS